MELTYTCISIASTSSASAGSDTTKTATPSGHHTSIESELPTSKPSPRLISLSTLIKPQRIPPSLSIHATSGSQRSRPSRGILPPEPLRDASSRTLLVRWSRSSRHHGSCPHAATTIPTARIPHSSVEFSGLGSFFTKP